MVKWSRRQFLVTSAAAAPAIVIPGILEGAAQRASGSPDPWSRVDAITKRIVAPRFPARDFDITKFGAVGDGNASCTDAMRKAIAACRAAGGGRVVVPE